MGHAVMSMVSPLNGNISMSALFEEDQRGGQGLLSDHHMLWIERCIILYT
jgi:hypothetical protein